MVDMNEIISGLWTAFAPFVSKAIITIIVVGILSAAISAISYLIKQKDKDKMK